jgi:serine/threonine protein phosphatase 1
MYYIIGDIHGDLIRLMHLMEKVLREFDTENDVMIFLGDYIDRGLYSFEVVDYLINLSARIHVVFLKGNHEDMMERYIRGEGDETVYLCNGGESTIKSYRRHMGSFIFPEEHRRFFQGLLLYYETDDFIAVHAGLNPDKAEIGEQKDRDLLWIRDAFFRADKRWKKTIIFGHTPVYLLSRTEGVVFDDERNIIGIDNGVIFGNSLACLRWPDRKIYYSD